MTNDASSADRLEQLEATASAAGAEGLEELLAAAPDRGLGALERWLEGAGEAELPRVRELLGRTAASDRLLLDWLGGQGTPEAAGAVQRYLEDPADRATAKAARKALHRLRSRGVEVPSAPRAARQGGFSLAADAGTLGEPQAWMTSFDGQGIRLVWVLRPSASGGNRLLQAAVHEADGLKEAEVVAVTRRDFRAYLDRLRGDDTFLVERTDAARADRWLAAAARALAAGGALPAAYRSWREEAGADPAAGPTDAPEPRVYETIPADEVRDRAELVDEAVKLLREPWLASWHVGGEVTERAAAEIRDAEESSLVLNDEQRKERMQDAIRRATEQAFDDETRRHYRRRLESLAGMLVRRGDEARARQALAAAVAFTEAPDLFARHAFARALVHRGVYLAYQELRRGEAAGEQESRIIRP